MAEQAHITRVVQKYGGTSVGSPERILAVARRVARTRARGHDTAVVVSAMAGETNRLFDLASRVSREPFTRELDVLVSTGEQVTTALLSMALHDLGVAAMSLQGHQVRISTDSDHGRARIRTIDKSRIEEAWAAGKVVVIAGYQGIDENQNITTLGRGGSDMTAVAIAAALGAACEIYPDVDGVYTTDPRICSDARRLARVSHEEMLEMASLGAKVLQTRSVECAMRFKVPVHVLSSFDESDQPNGTWVVPEEASMEDVLVSGIPADKNQAKITLQGVPDLPGLAGKIFGPLAAEGIVVDMIVQNVSPDDDRTDVTFTVGNSDLGKARTIVENVSKQIGAHKVVSSDRVGKVSVVGLGMRSHAGIAAEMFEVLADENINIQMISTSEIKISVVVDLDEVDRAVNVLHKKFFGDAAAAGAATDG
jgi:aspartate kinase